MIIIVQEEKKANKIIFKGSLLRFTSYTYMYVSLVKGIFHPLVCPLKAKSLFNRRLLTPLCCTVHAA